MTLENLLTQAGIGTKQFTDRYSGEYGAPVHDQHIYYAYEPSPPSHSQAVSKHSYSSGGLKSNASMSALTLLAFLFFLHILQQCIKEHMNEMSTAPIVVMSASRESDDVITKTAKVDKSGDVKFKSDEKNQDNQYDKKNPFKNSIADDNNNDKMMIISASEHEPRIKPKKQSYGYREDEDKESSFTGFVSAMNDKK